MRLLLPILLALLALALPANAHNGAVATAAPLADIVIDGDLSDWPQNMERYPIALPESGEPPRDEGDLQAFFPVGLNAGENELYLAVEVADESVVIDTTRDWNSQDGCEVYLSLDPNSALSVLQYTAYGNSVGSLGISTRNSGVQVEMRRAPNAHRYQWRLDPPARPGDPRESSPSPFRAAPASATRDRARTMAR
jgi:hypothetical protein